MKQEEILEYNKRCAEFLGWKETTEQFKIDWVGCKTKERLDRLNKQYIPILEKNGDVLFPDFSVINFHSDWNWIMNIVTAIREKGWRFDIQHHSSVTSSEIGVTIWRKFPGGGDEEVVELYHEDDKTVHVQSINQFLIWYKENNK
jgi:hypothetical protein